MTTNTKKETRPREIDRRKTLLRKLEECADSYDTEQAHCDADRALIEYIDDDEITTAYNAIAKWYA